MSVFQFLLVPNPLVVSGTATFYSAGGSVKKDVFTDSELTVKAANPYTLSARGTAQLYAEGGLYRVVLKDYTGAVVFDYDNISPDVAFSLAAATDVLNGTYGLVPAENVVAGVLTVKQENIGEGIFTFKGNDSTYYLVAIGANLADLSVGDPVPANFVIDGNINVYEWTTSEGVTAWNKIFGVGAQSFEGSACRSKMNVYGDSVSAFCAAANDGAGVKGSGKFGVVAKASGAIPLAPLVVVPTEALPTSDALPEGAVTSYAHFLWHYDDTHNRWDRAASGQVHSIINDLDGGASLSDVIDRCNLLLSIMRDFGMVSE